MFRLFTIYTWIHVYKSVYFLLSSDDDSIQWIDAAQDKCPGASARTGFLLAAVLSFAEEESQ